jgi:hypothetical protein
MQCADWRVWKAEKIVRTSYNWLGLSGAGPCGDLERVIEKSRFPGDRRAGQLIGVE